MLALNSLKLMAVPPFGAISIGTGAAMATDEYTRERHPSRRLRASEARAARPPPRAGVNL